MSGKQRRSSAVACACAVTILLLGCLGQAAAQGDAKRGEYLAQAGGCVSCHTNNAPDAIAFAGGRALKTPFGTFYGPNITPDPQAGIGRWSEADFIRAMRQGEGPDGSSLFPAFPYTSFTHINDSDLRDLWAYLRTLKPSSQPNKAHELNFPFSWRPLVKVWQQLFFSPGPFVPNPAASQAVNRGAYLVQALGHCSECHSPRNFLGATVQSRFLAGGKNPSNDKRIPNLTPTRLKKWNDAELKEFLESGLTPDDDSADETMGEVIRNTTSKLTPDDLAAMIAYLRSLPPLPEEPRNK